MQCAAVSPRVLAIAALLLALCPATTVRAQQSPSQAPQAQGQAPDCDAGVVRRQLKGQPMTEFLTECRAGRINPENLGKICNAAADQDKLSSDARRSFLEICTKGPA